GRWPAKPSAGNPPKMDAPDTVPAMTTHPQSARLQAWRDRAGTLPPALAAALEACLAKPVDRAECADVLDLLAMLGCDAPTQAAALWFALSRVDPALWQAEAPRLPEDLRRLLLAIIRDLRVVFVLLARQLARMRAAAALPEAERQELARLTRDIHAPLANRLGIWQLKWELEDLAFRHLEPDTYRRIAKLLDERRADREA